MLLNVLLLAGAMCAGVPPVEAAFRTLDVDAIAAALAVEPDCWQARIHLGRASLAAGEIDVAMTHFNAAANQVPENTVVHTWLGRAFLARAGQASSLGDAKRGVAYLEKAIGLDPENLDARQALASFHRAAPWIAGGDMDIADEQAAFVRTRDPLRGLLMLANNRMADGDEDEAIALLRDALAEHPEWTDAALALGMFYQQEERFDDAFAILKEYAARDGANPVMIYQLGRTAALSGRFLDEGREAMRRYIALVERDGTLDIPPSPAWWRLGMIEQHAGNKDAARAAYEKALQLDPENDDARKSLHALR